MALKALNERLGTAEATSWPSLDDGETVTNNDNFPTDGTTSVPLVSTHTLKKSESSTTATLVDVSVAKESQSLAKLPE